MKYLDLIWMVIVIAFGITALITLIVYWYLKKRKLRK